MNFENGTILEIKPSNRNKNIFAVFCDSQVLYLADVSNEELMAYLDKIRKKKQ